MSDDKSNLTGIVRAMQDNEDKPPSRFAENRRQAEALAASLTEEEATMLRQITAGWSKADSARHLGVDLHRFEKKRARLLAKLNAGSTTDAVRIGIYAGLD